MRKCTAASPALQQVREQMVAETVDPADAVLRSSSIRIDCLSGIAKSARMR